MKNIINGFKNINEDNIYKYFINFIGIAAIIIELSFSILDKFVYPDLFYSFLIIRIGFATIFIIVILINNLFQIKKYYYLYLILSLTGMGMICVICAITEEGFGSYYILGVVQALTGTLFFPMSNKQYIRMTIYNLIYFTSIIFFFHENYNFNLNIFIQVNSGICGLSIILIINKVLLNAFYEVYKKQLKLNKFLIGVYSHDLKNKICTPINILEFESKKDLISNTKIRDALVPLKSAFNFLGNLLNVNQLEINQIILKKEFINSENIQSYIYNNYNADCVSKNLQLIINFEKGNVLVDLHYFELLINNLMSNALQNTPHNNNKIITSLYFKNNLCYFKIANQSNLIPTHKIKFLFKKYFNAKMHTPYSKGLGLYYSKLIIELHGGTISYIPNSELSMNEFEIQLPLKN